MRVTEEAFKRLANSYINSQFPDRTPNDVSDKLFRSYFFCLLTQLLHCGIQASTQNLV